MSVTTPATLLLCILDHASQLKQLSIGDPRWLYMILRRIAEGAYLRHLQLFECTVSGITDTIDNLKLCLSSSHGDTARGDSSHPLLNVVLVTEQFSGTRRDTVKWLNVLEQSWLRVYVRGEPVKDISDLSDWQETETEDEISLGSSDDAASTTGVNEEGD